MTQNEALKYLQLARIIAAREGISEKQAYDLYVKSIVTKDLKNKKISEIIETKPYLVDNDINLEETINAIEKAGIRTIDVLEEDGYMQAIAKEIVEAYLEENK